MAGPETPLATSGFDAAQAIESATAPGMAIVGAGESTSTGTRQTPTVPPDPSISDQQQLTVDVTAPGYGWQLNRDDLGQGQVQQIRTDQFVTPVAEMKLPYGAIAARQQAVAEKRSRLEQAKQATARAFDPFKGISDPAAQHQSAFAKYASNTWWPELVAKVAKAQGTTTEEANDWLYSTPEGNAFVQREAHILDGIAKESFGMTGRVADLLEKHQKGEITIFPEDMKVVENWMSGKDHNSMPVSGERPEDFLWKGRELEGVMAFAAFQKGFLDGFDQYAQQHPQEIAFSRPAGAGGKVIMQVKDEGVFNDYKEAMVETAAEQGVLNGDRKRIRERLDRLIKDKYDVKVSTFDPYESVERRESAKAKADGTGSTVEVDFRPLSTKTKDGSTITGEATLMFKPTQETEGKRHTVKEISLNTTGVGGDDERVRDAMLVYRPGRKDWVIVGQSLTETGKKELSRVENLTKRLNGQVDVNPATLTMQLDKLQDESDKIWKTYSKRVEAPAATNSSAMSMYWNSADPSQVVAMRMGVPANEAQEMMKTLDGRRRLAEMAGIPVGSQKQSSASAKAATGSASIPESVKAFGVTYDRWSKLTADQKQEVIALAEERRKKSAPKPASAQSPKAAQVKPASAQMDSAPSPAASTTAATQPKENDVEPETPVIHPPKAVRDTLSMTTKKQGYEAMRDRVDANYEPGTYQYKNQQQADDSMQARRVAKDPDPKGFFKEGVVVESKIGDKKVFYIMDKTGMRPLSDYFEDKESARLVLDAFNKGEIHEEFLSKRSRSTKQAFEKLLNAK